MIAVDERVNVVKKLRSEMVFDEQRRRVGGERKQEVRWMEPL